MLPNAHRLVEFPMKVIDAARAAVADDNLLAILGYPVLKYLLKPIFRTS